MPVLDIKYRIEDKWITLAAGAPTRKTSEPLEFCVLHTLDSTPRVKLTEVSDGLHPIMLEPVQIFYDRDKQLALFKPVTLLEQGEYIMSAWLETPYYTIQKSELLQAGSIISNLLQVDDFSITHIDKENILIAVVIRNLSLFTVVTQVDLAANDVICSFGQMQWCPDGVKVFTAVLPLSELSQVGKISVLISNEELASLRCDIQPIMVETDRVLVMAVKITSTNNGGE